MHKSGLCEIVCVCVCFFAMRMCNPVKISNTVNRQTSIHCTIFHKQTVFDCAMLCLYTRTRWLTICQDIEHGAWRDCIVYMEQIQRKWYTLFAMLPLTSMFTDTNVEIQFLCNCIPNYGIFFRSFSCDTYKWYIMCAQSHFVWGDCALSNTRYQSIWFPLTIACGQILEDAPQPHSRLSFNIDHCIE